MEYTYLNLSRLETCCHALAAKIAKMLDYNASDEMLVYTGITDEGPLWEGYKRSITDECQDRIQSYLCEQRQNSGNTKQSYSIINAIINTFSIKDNNLVSWQDKRKFRDLQTTNHLDKVLRHFFTSSDEALTTAMYDSLKASLWNSYPVISYLYYLKNPSRFVVMRPDNFRRRLKLLGIKNDCTKQNTWDNYQVFMDILRELQSWLRSYLHCGKEITLLDAHSFLWLFYLIEEDEIQSGGSKMNDKALVDLAFTMLERAYCPYSCFPVGAALLCADGSVFTGCNVENAAYGHAICAERTALVKAVSEGHRDDFVTLAIAGNCEDYCWPCGACRQMLYEFAPGLRVLAANRAHDFVAVGLEELLPHGFGPKNLA